MASPPSCWTAVIIRPTPRWQTDELFSQTSDFLHQVWMEISNRDTPLLELPPTLPPNVGIGIEYTDHDFGNSRVQETHATRCLVPARSARFQG